MTFKFFFFPLLVANKSVQTKKKKRSGERTLPHQQHKHILDTLNKTAFSFIPTRSHGSLEKNML